MTRAVVDDLADQITTTLNAASFSLAFTATRTRRPKKRAEDLRALTVLVIATKSATDVAESTRGKVAEEHQVDVAVMKKLANVDDLAEGDALSYLAEQIRDYLRRRTVPPAIGATCTAAEFVDGAEAGYAPAHMDEFGVFTSVVRSTWLSWRAAT